ncbi:unnamed protein product [Xylocopa violacea]|uniref:CCHC-type domain-containing protein n=1 Tax=Xylocopa violacea TaxID=135666 RepID=A0ABP1MW21_XYLVO
MEGDTSDTERAVVTQKYSRKGKHVRKRRLLSETETDMERPQKRNEKDTRAENKTNATEKQRTEESENEHEMDIDSADTGNIRSIKIRAETIQKKLVNHLTNPDNGIKQGTTRYILTKIGNLQSLLQESLLLNSRLEGQIEALKSETRKQRKDFVAAEKKAAITVQAQPQKMTYAERLGIKSKAAELSNLKQDPPNVAVIRPADKTKFTNSEETKRALIDLVSPKENSLQVKNVRKVQGSAIIVETAKSGNVQTLIQSEKLKSAGLLVDIPVKKNPRIIVYGAPRTENDEDVIQAILDQNCSEQEKKKYAQQMKIAFKTGNKNNKDSCNIVLETSKEAREILIKKERLYIMWQCCRAQDYIAATRCYKCQAYGHTTKHCRSETDVCGHCATAGHIFKNCPNRNKPATHNQQKDGIKILQINMRNTQFVNIETARLMEQQNIDILLMQEPYNPGGKHIGLNSSSIIITGGKQNCAVQASIAIKRNRLTVLKVAHLSNEHCICIETTSEIGRIYFVNMYFQYSHDIDSYLEQLQKILTNLKGEKVIIAADANAKSPLWHSNITDERGEKLEQLIARNNLIVSNEPGNPPTYSSPTGTSNIDVTLITYPAARLMETWTVQENWTSSDHNAIVYSLTKDKIKDSTATITKTPRFRTSKINWETFRNTLTTEKQEILNNWNNKLEEDIEGAAQTIHNCILNTCNKTLGHRKTRISAVPWWTEALAKLKRHTYRKRKTFQQTKDAEKRAKAKEEYHIIRNKYTTEIRKTKKECWEKFVTDEGNAKPWGTVYKICMQKITPERALATCESGTEHTITWKDTAKGFLQTLVPDDRKLPIDLEIRYAAYRYKIRRKRTFEIEQYVHTETSNTEATIARIETHLMTTWQQRWNDSDTGRHTYSLLPDVRSRMDMSWLYLNHYMTQFLSGHGDFAQYLFKSRISINRYCGCGEEETAIHAILHCTQHEEERKRLQTKYREVNLPWPPDTPDILKQQTYKELARTIEEILKKKEKLWTRRPKRRRDRR